MLSKKQRVTRKLFNFPLKSRKTLNTKHFLVHITPSNTFRVAVIVSKKVAKKAAERNLLRRRVYSVVKDANLDESNKQLLFIVKTGSASANKKELKEELSELLKKV